MEAPVRVYSYPSSVVRQLVADLLAASLGGMAFFMTSWGTDYFPFVVLATFFGVWAALVSFQLRRRKRARIWLYADRAVWVGLWGNRREASLAQLGEPRKFPAILSDARGTCHSTPSGFLCFTEQLEGYGDLARRLEGAPQGWVARELPPTPLPWAFDRVFAYGGSLRLHASLKIFFAFGFLILTSALVGTPWLPVACLSSLALVVWGAFDTGQIHNARIELIGGRLVQFDRWGQPVRSVAVATLNSVVAPEDPLHGRCRIEGDDGRIEFDRNLEGMLPLIQGGYLIIADRHRRALRGIPVDAPPVATSSSSTRA